jgi:4-amino-4-deoxy-L-arabinose transferase-like glycosyltransferase
MGAVFMLYLFMRKLFDREDLALTTAFVAAINPLFVFFGRQTQLVNPAVFFMITSAYFYLKWRENMTLKNMFLVSIFLALTLLTKYDFFIIVLPIAFTLPYKKLFDKNFIKKNIPQYVTGFFILLSFPLWFLYTKIKAVELNSREFANAIDLGSIFNASWWVTIKNYVVFESFTMWGIIFATLGLIALITFYNKKNFGNKFILAFSIGSVIWIFIVSGYLKGHVYHEYPIAPLLIILIAYFFVVTSINIEKIVKIKYSRYAVIAILLIILLLPSLKAKDRMFDTQFIGLDIAGEYIKQNSQPNERLLFPSHQSYGVLWHADRKGYGKGWDSADAIKYAEENRSVNWIFVYQWGMKVFEDKERWDYISQHYSLKQFAFQQNQEGIRPVYFLLRRGGNFNISNINDLLEGKQPEYKDYEYAFGKNRLHYINV